MAAGYIYIVQLGEHVSTNTPIFKIGRTKNIPKRLEDYGKDALLLLSVYSLDYVRHEGEVKQLFKQSFIHRTELGFEYFEGDINAMILKVIHIVQQDLIQLSIDRPRKDNLLKYDKLLDCFKDYCSLFDCDFATCQDIFIYASNALRQHDINVTMKDIMKILHDLKIIKIGSSCYIMPTGMNRIKCWILNTFEFNSNYRISTEDAYQRFKHHFQRDITKLKFSLIMSHLGYSNTPFNGTRYYVGFRLKQSNPT